MSRVSFTINGGNNVSATAQQGHIYISFNVHRRGLRQQRNQIKKKELWSSGVELLPGAQSGRTGH